MPEDVGYATDKVYKVEKILGHKGNGRKRQVFTQWKGYPMEECSWEPREQFDGPYSEGIRGGDCGRKSERGAGGSAGLLGLVAELEDGTSSGGAGYGEGVMIGSQ